MLLEICRTLAWRVGCAEVAVEGIESQSQRPVCLCFCGRIPSPKVCLELRFAIIPVTSLLPVCHFASTVRPDEFGRYYQHDPSKSLGRLSIAECQHKRVDTSTRHARVADGICRLIWNMREQTAPSPHDLMVRYETYETSPSPISPCQVIGALPNYRPLNTSIPTAWMANGCVSAAHNLSTGWLT
jgi:hypothetical protein